ncbi:Na+/H+ antiporter NhaD type [Desulfocucumis palustris]|uniref:Na+/H+ antiporter NhaD type n=1 Tax=Desulfocucumis palustris TaxID=1898651 RepID=A0A2L2XDJ7_9FIRM|nr:ArsB/NhaD family transporter [Desulfocucumis palustris]GBF34429.1 Na+/H+ antiporter NhaD type [Desulfocucumis palustris]
MSAQTQILFTGGIFLLTYAMIMLEKIHRTVVALAGAMIVILAGIVSQEQAVESVDFNTIGLLTGMMIIVGVTRRTGVFEFMAVFAAKVAKGDPAKIMISLATITAVSSALLDNVTTVLLIVPVTFVIAKQLDVNPIPYLIAEVVASNIGGTATLIGDPPNIMIGSATGLGFMDFVLALAPVIVVIHIAAMIWLKVLYRKDMVTREELKRNIMALNEKDEIKDEKLLKKCLAAIAITVLGFVLHQYLHLESGTVALAGATLLLLITGDEPEHALSAVEWPVIFFFVGLFIIVGALEHVGIIEAIARKSLEVTGGAILPTGLLILWLSAILSAFIDNIPFVATMIPLIQEMGRLGGIANLEPLWWSLSLGACLGGNGTLIGASANVVVAGMAEKRGAYLTFIHFTKVAFPMMIMSIIISTGYLVLFYLR